MDVLTLSTDKLQKLVLRELRRSTTGRLARRTILKAIADLSPNKLNRRQREVLKDRLHNAIGAMQRQKPEKIAQRRDSSDFIRLTGHKNKRPKPSMAQLIQRVKSRVKSVEFTCERCEQINTVKDIETEIQCVHCFEYFM